MCSQPAAWCLLGCGETRYGAGASAGARPGSHKQHAELCQLAESAGGGAGVRGPTAAATCFKSVVLCARELPSIGPLLAFCAHAHLFGLPGRNCCSRERPEVGVVTGRSSL